MKKEEGLVKSIFSYSISSWINIFVGLFYTVISTRVLVPEVYGMVSIFLSASNTLMYVVCLGLDASFIRFFNERPDEEKQNVFSFKLLFVITFVVLVTFLGTTILCFDWFNQYMFGRVSWFLTIMLYTSVYSNLLLRFFNIIYRMSFNVKQYTIQNILIQSSMKMLVLIAALFNPTYEVVILFQVVGIAIITIVYLKIQWRDIVPPFKWFKYNRISFEGYGGVFKYALFSAPLYISTNINVLLTQQAVRSALGSNALGIYAAVNIFATLFGALQTGFSTFWSAYIYRNYDKEQEKIRAMTDYVMLVGTISLGMFVIMRKPLYLFIGEQYQSSVNFFTLILMVNVFNLLAQSTIYGIDIVKKNYITAITNCVYVVVNAIVVGIAAKEFGLVGVAYAVMLARLALYMVNTVIAQHYYKTITSSSRFALELILIIIIAATPTFSFYAYAAEIITACLLIFTALIYNKQYSQIFDFLKAKIRKAGV